MGEESEAGSWWGGWLQAAKDKSTEAITFIRRDLEEFTAVVQTDTRNLVASTTSTIRDHIALTDAESSTVDVATSSPSNAESTSGSTTSPLSASGSDSNAFANLVTPNQNSAAADVAAAADGANLGSNASPLALLGISEDEVKEVKEFASKTGEYVSKGFSSFLSSVSQALIIPPDDDDEDPIVFKDGGMILNRAEARLHCLRIDPSTYSEEPEGPSYDYERWLDENDLEEQKLEIANLLIDCPEMRAHYTQMVPSIVSHAQFWSRYFFKLEQMEAEEKRREALKARAAKDDVTDLGWGDEEEQESGKSQEPEPLALSTTQVPVSTTSNASSTSTSTIPSAPITVPSTASSTVSSTAFSASTSSDAPLLTSELFKVRPNIATEDLSAAQIDSLLSMEDEMRSGRNASSSLLLSSPPSDVDSRSRVGKDSKMDSKVVDELLEKEASLSPRKAKRSAVVESLEGGSSRNDHSEEVVLGLKDDDDDDNSVVESAALDDDENFVVESAALDRDVSSELTNQEFSLKKEMVKTTLESVAEKSRKGETKNASVLEDDDDVVNFQTDNTDEKPVDEEETANVDAEVETVNAHESMKGLIIVDGVDDDSAIASRTTPTPTPSSKESATSGDDWEKDLELDLTEEEKTIAEKLLNDGEKLDDDWENWE